MAVAGFLDVHRRLPFTAVEMVYKVQGNSSFGSLSGLLYSPPPPQSYCLPQRKSKYHTSSLKSPSSSHTYRKHGFFQPPPCLGHYHFGHHPPGPRRDLGGGGQAARYRRLPRSGRKAFQHCRPLRRVDLQPRLPPHEHSLQAFVLAEQLLAVRVTP